jgi:hypothetical protein
MIESCSAFLLCAFQVIAMYTAQNLPPRIILSRSAMTERPGAFQILPYMELSDPEAGWSNVTVTLSIKPMDSNIQNPTSSFQFKRWTPWEMPQATVRLPIFNMFSKISISHNAFQDVSVRHIGYPGYVFRKVDCRDYGMPPVSVSIEGPNSDGMLLSNMLYR